MSLTKENNFPENIRPISKRVQSFRGLQLVLPVGASLPRVPGHGVLPPEARLAHDGGRPHEVLWERNNIEECWRHRRKEGFSREIFQYKYSEQVKIIHLNISHVWLIRRFQVQCVFLWVYYVWDFQCFCRNRCIFSHQQVPQPPIPSLRSAGVEILHPAGGGAHVRA